MQSDYVQSGCDQKYSFQFGGMGESNLWEQFDDSLADADEPVLEFGNFYKDISILTSSQCDQIWRKFATLAGF